MTEEEFNNLRIGQRIYDSDTKSIHEYNGLAGKDFSDPHFKDGLHVIKTCHRNGGYWSQWDKEHLMNGFRARK